MIRKRVPNIDDPIGNEVTISSGGNMITSFFVTISLSSLVVGT